MGIRTFTDVLHDWVCSRRPETVLQVKSDSEYTISIRVFVRQSVRCKVTDKAPTVHANRPWQSSYHAHSTSAEPTRTPARVAPPIAQSFPSSSAWCDTAAFPNALEDALTDSPDADAAALLATTLEATVRSPLEDAPSTPVPVADATPVSDAMPVSEAEAESGMLSESEPSAVLALSGRERVSVALTLPVGSAVSVVAAPVSLAAAEESVSRPESVAVAAPVRDEGQREVDGGTRNGRAYLLQQWWCLLHPARRQG